MFYKSHLPTDPGGGGSPCCNVAVSVTGRIPLVSPVVQAQVREVCFVLPSQGHPADVTVGFSSFCASAIVTSIVNGIDVCAGPFPLQAQLTSWYLCGPTTSLPLMNFFLGGNLLIYQKLVKFKGICLLYFTPFLLAKLTS